LIANEYVNTILVVHPSVKMVILRGDISNLRLQSPSTHVIRLENGQDPRTISFDGTAVASAADPNAVQPDDTDVPSDAADVADPGVASKPTP